MQSTTTLNSQGLPLFSPVQKQYFSSTLSHQGPAAGAFAYWATKTLCYGTAVGGVFALIPFLP